MLASAKAAAAPNDNQRNTRVGAMCRSAIAPKNNGDTTAASAPVAVGVSCWWARQRRNDKGRRNFLRPFARLPFRSTRYGVGAPTTTPSYVTDRGTRSPTLKIEINGTITAVEKIQILKPGVLVGDIRTPLIAIEEGSHFHGMCDMGVRAWSEPAPVSMAS